tara:strand:- start:9158 stop:9430 length:273 start_codon:yes stop_codon:yes gene_type:complete
MDKVNVDMEELKSFLAKRGEVDILNLIKEAEEEYCKHIDPDYNPDTDSEDYDSEESSVGEVEEEVEEDEHGLVVEVIKVKKVCENHCAIA